MAIDDNYFNLYVLKEFLKLDYNVKICLSGDDALNEIKLKR